MPTYSYQRPVRVTADGSNEKYRNDHLKHFFDNEVYNNIMSLSTEEKEIWFNMQKNYELLFIKVHGNLNEIINSVVFLPTALENGVDNILVNQYKEWLDKQNV